jgi:hypothetical protein
MDNGMDISKLVELIMQNPDIVERIKSLKNESESVSAKEKAEPENADSGGLHKKRNATRRGALLAALKPYLSEKRSKAIDTMLSAIDVFDLIKGG